VKTVRRYLARTIYVVLFVALFPFAIVKIVLDSFFETCVETLDSLEWIADE
jgi:lipopolysaccharide export LptBFGC system permease protein LptF